MQNLFGKILLKVRSCWKASTCWKAIISNDGIEAYYFRSFIIPASFIFKFTHMATLLQSLRFSLFSFLREFRPQLSDVKSWVHLNLFYHFDVSKLLQHLAKLWYFSMWNVALYYLTHLCYWARPNNSISSVRLVTLELSLLTNSFKAALILFDLSKAQQPIFDVRQRSPLAWSEKPFHSRTGGLPFPNSQSRC